MSLADLARRIADDIAGIRRALEALVERERGPAALVQDGELTPAGARFLEDFKARQGEACRRRRERGRVDVRPEHYEELSKRMARQR